MTWETVSSSSLAPRQQTLSLISKAVRCDGGTTSCGLYLTAWQRSTITMCSLAESQCIAVLSARRCTVTGSTLSAKSTIWQSGILHRLSFSWALDVLLGCPKEVTLETGSVRSARSGIRRERRAGHVALSSKNMNKKKDDGPSVTPASFCGKEYSRPFNPYAEEAWPHESEAWAAELLGEVLRHEYPMQTRPMDFSFAFAQE